MDADEQKKQTQKSTFLTGCQLDGSNVLPAARLRHAIQNSLRHYRELLGYRYDILLSVRFVLAAVLYIIQVF